MVCYNLWRVCNVSIIIFWQMKFILMHFCYLKMIIFRFLTINILFFYLDLMVKLEALNPFLTISFSTLNVLRWELRR